MYDVRFTSEQVTENYKPKKKFRVVTTQEGKSLCYASKGSICDLNGKQIAAFSRKEKREENEKKFTVRLYESDYGEFVIKENYLYLGSEFLGVMPDRKRFIPFILLGVLGFLLASTIVAAVIAGLPKDDIPVIAVKDHNGDWKAQGTVAVLDEKIHPDSNGEYEFIIRNANDVRLYYEFSIEEYYNGKPAENFPLEYRVRVNNDLVGSEDWLSAEELHFKDLIFLPQSDYLVTLEWRWQFESGNDELDTTFGRDGGTYTLELFLTAETIDETD